MPFTQVDILTDDEGDLVVSSSGDLKLATEAETLRQDIKFRVRTDALDYTPNPFIGANLGSLLGEPNNRRTGSLLKEQTHIALTQDNRVPTGVLFVEVIPINFDAVQLFVVISDRVGNETAPTVITQVISFLPTTPGDESITNITE